MGLNSNWLLGESKCDYVTESWGPGPRHSKANKQARWKGKFALFRMLATGVGEDRCLSKGGSPSTDNQRGKSFYRLREGATCRNSTVCSYDHLQVGHWWSDQLHLDCFKYS